MRIEIDPKIEKVLDTIKAEHYIFGKGHSDTIRYLVEYYERHQAIEKVLQEELGKIPDAIETGLLRAMRVVMANLLSEKLKIEKWELRE